MIEAKIVADSLNTATGDRLTTFVCTYPRFIHSEALTHRIFSRNAASSRAIPVKKMLSAVWKDPAVPVHWGANQKGMQASEELSGFRLWLSRRIWLWSRLPILAMVWTLTKVGLHKQVANRLLEPWMWMTVIISSTEYENFFKLRLDAAAQPEIRKLAQEMQWEMSDSSPKKMQPGDWHLPMTSMSFTSPQTYLIEPRLLRNNIPIEAKTAVARCARVSYVLHESNKTVEEDEKMFERLSTSGHWSPFEHVAIAMTPNIDLFSSSNFASGWAQLRKLYVGENGKTLKNSVA